MSDQSTDLRREELAADLDSNSKSHGRWDLFNFYWAICLTYVSLGSSIIATIEILGEFVGTKLVALFVALPAVTILIEATLRISDRASWHKIYKIELCALYRDLKYKGADVGEISDKFTALQRKMADTRPILGAPKMGSSSQGDG